MGNDDVLKKVLKGLASTKGDSPEARREQTKRTVLGRDQAAQDRARRNTQTKGFNRKEESRKKAESDERWGRRG